MSHAVRIRHRAEKELERVPRSDRQRVVEAIHRLAENPHAGGALVGDLRGLRRVRVGDWRVLYKVDNEASVVLIVRVAHRRDAYRRRAR